MNRRLWLCLALVVILPLTSPAEQDEDARVDPPKGGAPWHHERTGLSLPQEIGELRMEGGVIFKQASFGQSVRFTNRQHGARVDIYVYPCRGKSGTTEERKQAAEEEITQVMAGLKEMEKRGNYRQVSWDKGNERQITLEDGSKTYSITAPAHYEIKDQGSDPPTFTPLESLASVTIYKDHYIKLRYTLPAGASKEALAARDEFTKTLQRCVFDASFRPAILKHIATYRRDPLSDAARDAAGGIVAFSDKSPLVDVVVGPGLMDFADRCETQIKDAHLDVVRAFVVGATDAALHDQGPAKIVEAAIAEVKDLCGKLRAKHPKFNVPSLKDFETAVRSDNEKFLKEKP